MVGTLQSWVIPVVRTFAVAVLGIAVAGQTASGQDYKVMSFNVRVGSANDGSNSWQYRKDLAVQTVATFNPDFFGVQESLSYQSDYLKDNLSGYAKVGTGRSADGSGEQSAIFYKTSKFTKVRNGQYWLSPTPNQAGSIGWDAQFPRIVTWVELRDKSNPSFSFTYFNTHWDHVGDTARLNSATLMRDKVREISYGIPTIISGDFNADEGTNPYNRLMGIDNYDTYRDFQDSYAVDHPGNQATVGTAHGFSGTAGDRRIDWILPDYDFDVLDAAIVKTSYNGKYPSDHFPITAVLHASPPGASLVVPEPASIGVLAAGGLLLMRRRR